jgi:hypothetical protein
LSGKVFVSAARNDNKDGSFEKPFKTLPKLATEADPEKNIEIILRKGL